MSNDYICRMTIDILGCGDSINRFEYAGNKTIGVNDVFRFFHVENLVVIDAPDKFTKERLDVIIQSTPKKFYSSVEAWRPYNENFQFIKLASPRGSCDKLDHRELFPYSNSSPFVAISLAYKMGAKKIRLFGADYTNHVKLCEKYAIERVMKDFKEMNKALTLRGVKLFVTKESALSKIIKPF